MRAGSPCPAGAGGAHPTSPEAVEQAARPLLLRGGIVFWRLLGREADCLPPWRDLLRVYRRLEARGEIRGGRFVAGFAGEQIALPEAQRLEVVLAERERVLGAEHPDTLVTTQELSKQQ